MILFSMYVVYSIDICLHHIIIYIFIYTYIYIIYIHYIFICQHLVRLRGML